MSLKAPPGPLRVLALLSDGDAVLGGEADGEPLDAPHPDGEVRLLEGTHRAPAPAVKLDLRASSGGVIALWLVGPPRASASGDLIEKPGWRK